MSIIWTNPARSASICAIFLFPNLLRFACQYPLVNLDCQLFDAIVNALRRGSGCGRRHYASNEREYHDSDDAGDGEEHILICGFVIR